MRCWSGAAAWPWKGGSGEMGTRKSATPSARIGRTGRSGNTTLAMPDPELRSRPIEHEDKPWGSFSTLEEGPGYKVKRLVIQPGHRLSLQKHRQRAEPWVVVAGAATVWNGAEVLTLRCRQCTVIPRQAWHRIENRGRVPTVVIEVQHGAYLGEDDIVRKQDDYGRVRN
jgi:mannose-6-phosphate isomerase